MSRAHSGHRVVSRLYRRSSTAAQLNGLLREFWRQEEGRDAEASACMIDAQSRTGCQLAHLPNDLPPSGAGGLGP
ncbi:hypothetical protein ACWGK6_41685 [Streptomyces violaceusniger]